jgi:hypothetical protein
VYHVCVDATWISVHRPACSAEELVGRGGDWSYALDYLHEDLLASRRQLHGDDGGYTHGYTHGDEETVGGKRRLGSGPPGGKTHTMGAGRDSASAKHIMSTVTGSNDGIRAKSSNAAHHVGQPKQGSIKVINQQRKRSSGKSRTKAPPSLRQSDGAATPPSEGGWVDGLLPMALTADFSGSTRWRASSPNPSYRNPDSNSSAPAFSSSGASIFTASIDVHPAVGSAGAAYPSPSAGPAYRDGTGPSAVRLPPGEHWVVAWVEMDRTWGEGMCICVCTASNIC